jgi:hypothetical protein
MTESAIRARADKYNHRAPSPVVNRSVADQIAKDRAALLDILEELRAAP